MVLSQSRKRSHQKGARAPEEKLIYPYCIDPHHNEPSVFPAEMSNLRIGKEIRRDGPGPLHKGHALNAHIYFITYGIRGGCKQEVSADLRLR